MNIEVDLIAFLKSMEERLTKGMDDLSIEQKALTTAQLAANSKVSDHERRLIDVEDQLKWAKRTAWGAFVAFIGLVIEAIRHFLWGK